MIRITNSAEVLYARLSDERKTGELLPLPVDFYRKLDLKENASDTDTTVNNNKLLNTLKAKRIQKLLIYLAYDRQPPQPIPAEEGELYKRIRAVVSNTDADEKSSRIKVLSDIPEIATPTGGKIGPYRANEIIELQDESDVEFVLKNKIGEKI